MTATLIDTCADPDLSDAERLKLLLLLLGEKDFEPIQKVQFISHVSPTVIKGLLAAGRKLEVIPSWLHPHAVIEILRAQWGDRDATPKPVIDYLNDANWCFSVADVTDLLLVILELDTRDSWYKVSTYVVVAYLRFAYGLRDICNPYDNIYMAQVVRIYRAFVVRRTAKLFYTRASEHGADVIYRIMPSVDSETFAYLDFMAEFIHVAWIASQSFVTPKQVHYLSQTL